MRLDGYTETVPDLFQQVTGSSPSGGGRQRFSPLAGVVRGGRGVAACWPIAGAGAHARAGRETDLPPLPKANGRLPFKAKPRLKTASPRHSFKTATPDQTPNPPPKGG